MRDEILSNIDNPQQLEKLYRDHKLGFKKEFNNIYETIKEHKIALFWNERLNYESGEISWSSRNELTLIIFISLLAGLAAKLPDILGIDREFFYTRNIGCIPFPSLAIYFAWKNKVHMRTIVIASIAIIISMIYINLLPSNNKSDTLNLACIHLPLFLWAILGFTYVGDSLFNPSKRIEFLRYNGDLIVMTTLIIISGGLLTAITIGLFKLIDFNIQKFYFEYIVMVGLPAAPIFGTFLTQTNSQLVSKVSPIIARIFSPLVLITLVIYLIAIVYSGKDPYNDREFLLIFNLLLIAVMALILFSIAESSRSEKNKQATVILFLLSSVTIIVNAIALSAILFRISEWGITPNRLAVLGGNILILTNLLLVTFYIFKSIKHPDKIESVEKSIGNFLPIYTLWTIMVIFIFPIVFNFK